MKFALSSVSVSVMFATMAACSPPQAASGSPSEPGSNAFYELCSSCGVVLSITPVTEQGSSTGAGAVIGAVVGGVAGNQVGGGSGNDIATAAGVIGGAFLGNNIEQNRNATTWYDIVIEMEEGGRQSIAVQDPQNLSPGASVNVHGNNISLR
ncbi:MAG: glycine zipper 2TM domain-containing protein [Pseudohongiellaceae bacterium]